MKLKKGYITHAAGNQHLMVGTPGTGFSGLVRSNETAAFIVQQLKKATTREQIVDAMEKEYNAPRDVLVKDVDMILDKLRSIGALDE